jgi:hypothetical protein
MINWLRTFFMPPAEVRLVHVPYSKEVPDATYISGPMTGMPEMNFPAFNRAAANLRSLGYRVVNPAELDELDEGQTLEWEDYMRRDIAAMVASCNRIAMLPGWHRSRGAMAEHFIATTLGMTVMFLNDQGEVA